MKFDYCIGNPPYQQETAIKETTNGQKTSKRIFSDFQLSIDKIADHTCLIYPALGWILGGSRGLAKFGKTQINDPHLAKLSVYRNATDCFPGVGIRDGISIVVKDMQSERATFVYDYIVKGKKLNIDAKHPGDELFIIDPTQVPIAKKVKDFVAKYQLTWLNTSIQPRTMFGIESNFVEENPEKVRLYKEGEKLADDEIKLFTNDRAGSAGRPTWFITKRNHIPKNKQLIDKYKVIVASANALGTDRNQQLDLLTPGTAFGRSRLCLRVFDTLAEGQNFVKYLKSNTIRFMSFISAGTGIRNNFSLAPDVKEYNNNDLIDFSEDIDKQFQQLLDLTEDEVKFINEFVDNNFFKYKR